MEEAPAENQPAHRTLRERGDRKWYDDGDEEEEEAIEMVRGFRLEDKIESDRFRPCFLRELHGSELTLAFIQKNGTPMLIREKTGLGLRVPASDFTVKHVQMLVGANRLLDVMDVATQKNEEMTMKEWCKYYNKPEKNRLLNVISLEFSHTELESYVQSPTVVRQIDWVDACWPQELKDLQTESTNAIDDMMYPKVQKYCLMSVKGCYTDFHIDFGGTSVWYHILKGTKIFWLIPPTERNLSLYENWVLSGKQSDVFFGDTVDNCGRLKLTAGNTFFIPSGWIHAVYTPENSLVFGGNFLHSFAIERQLQIARVESSTRVPQKFRYPFFTEMLWYVLANYVLAILGTNHLETTVEGPTVALGNRVHLTSQEFYGLKAIVLYLHGLQTCRKNVPEMLKDPAALIKDVQTVVDMHEGDKAYLAVTGRSILTGVSDTDVRPNMKPQVMAMVQSSKGYFQEAMDGSAASQVTDSNKMVIEQDYHRQRRENCEKCDACLRKNCGECNFFHDFVNLGGAAGANQCLQPMLPATATCILCNLDGWGELLAVSLPKAPQRTPSSLMECSICFEVAHPHCYAVYLPDVEGLWNNDLPNSWECPKCCSNRQSSESHEDGATGGFFNQPSSPALDLNNSFNGDVKPDSDQDSFNDTRDDYFGEHDIGQFHSSQEDSNGESRFPIRPHRPIPRETPIVLKTPIHIVRPTPLRYNSSSNAGNPLMDHDFMLSVFRYLSPGELAKCARVCRLWGRFSIDPSLWQCMNVCHETVTGLHLVGIVRRQPLMLHLDWSNISKVQLSWLIARLPQLRGLSIQGNSWLTASALCTCLCPPLHALDLSYVSGLNDLTLRGVLASPPDSRPGLIDTDTRLGRLRCLKIAGCDISDVSLRNIIYLLPFLAVLDISSCARITDAGVIQLLAPNAPTLTNLKSLNLSGIQSLTDLTLEYLANAHALLILNISHLPLISYEAVGRFLQRRGHEVEVTLDEHLAPLNAAME